MNHWLWNIKKKKMYNKIDEIGMEVLSEGGTLSDLFALLDDEQLEFLMNMSMKEFLADPDELSFAFDLKSE